jgi:anti-anti-sigma factor
VNRRTVALDLTRVEAIDGGGIGLLICLQGWARAAGIELKLMNPAQHVREMLELTNLDSVFDICLSEDATLRHPTVVGATEETAAYDCD